MTRGDTRITLHVRDLRASGVVRNTLAIAGRLAREHEVTVAVGHARGLFNAGALPRGVRLLPLGDGDASPVRLAWALRRHVRHWRPEAILSCGNLGHATVLMACLGLHRPRRLYRISNAVDRPGQPASTWRRLLARAVAADATRLLIVGEATAACPVYARPIASGRARIVPNGVDPAAIRAAAARAPAATVPDDGLPLLVSVGRLHRQKDFPTLVRAAALADRVRPLRLVIVGGGDPAIAADLRAIAQAEGFAGRLVLVDETADIFGWLGRADAFALASRWEGSSMALLEAMALDLPVVATREAGDARTVLADGRYGLLAPAGRADLLAAAIGRQLSDTAVRPGGRIDDYRLDDTLDVVAATVAAAVKGPRVAARPSFSTPAPSA